MTESNFYEQGLHFNCTRCGNCCRPQSGHLFLTASDLRRLAESMEMSDEEFFLEYCEIVDLQLAQRVSLVAEEDGACVFLGDEGCDVYEHRPLQCRTYPFWATNLMDQRSWDEGTADCPGAKASKLWSREQIEACVQSREREPLLDVGE